MANLTLTTYLSEKIQRLYAETLPWYWGVFKWLGVVLPLSVLRAIKVTLAISVFGLVQYASRRIREKKIKTRDWQLLLLVFSSIWFIFWLLMWDYMLVRSIGFSHGLQGRNFFPNIAAHMLLLTFGLWEVMRKFQKQILKIAVIGVVVLNFIALFTMLKSYYTITPAMTFLTEASQYKPWFFKGGGLILWFVLYVTLLANFLYRLVGLNRRER